MAKVTNLTDRGVKLRKWRVLPNSSKVVDQEGHIHDSLPDEVAYCRQAKALADEGVLKLAGYTPAKLRKKVQENPGAKPIVPDPPKEAPKIEVTETTDKSKDPTVEVAPEKKSKKRGGKK
jgi:hypothetical protein